MDKKQVKSDFQFLREDERVLGILVFGSQVKNEAHERSDIDICVVAPGAKPWEVLKKVYSGVDVGKRGYDVHTFEEFTLELKHYVMENHEILWTRDRGKLEEYFYNYRKLWQDQAKARGVV